MSILSDLVERARAILFRGRDERELAEEIQFHLEMSAEQLRQAGASDAEARRQSRIALGGIERTREEVRDARGTRLLDDGASDARYALRALRRSPGFAAVVVLTLAVGIGGITAVFSALDAVLLRPLPYAQPGQLVRLYQATVNDPGQHGFVTPVHFLAYRDRMSLLANTAAILTYSTSGADIGGAEHPERITILPVSAGYFEVMRVQPQLGRGFDRDEETAAHVIVLSHDLWKRQLHGNPAAVGRPFLMNGTAYSIVGVMPAGYTDPVAGAVDAYVPLDLGPGRDPTNADNHYLTVLARLRTGTTVARAQAELDALGVRLASVYPDAKHTTAHLYPLKDDIVGPASRGLEIILGAVALVMLIVCVNIANLLLVRGSERARELAVRAALGAGRARLARQLLVESLTLALAGAVAGLVVARGAMRAIVALGGGSVPRLDGLSLDPRVLAFCIAVASVSALIFGSIPALHAARTDPSDVLREQSRSATAGSGQGRLRALLVISQVALAFVLLAGAGVLLASFQRLREVDLGVPAAHVLTFELHLPEARYDSTARARFYETVAQQIGAIPGVRAAGGISRLPVTGSYNSWGVNPLTGPLVASRVNQPSIEQRIVSGNYFGVMGLAATRGRLFDFRDDATAPQRVVVSQAAARQLFATADPIGQRLHTGGRTVEVIGVVPDVALDVQGGRYPTIYHAHTQYAGDRNWDLTQVVATTGAPDAPLAAIRAVVAAMDPQLVVYHALPFDAVIGQGSAQRAFTLYILGGFAGIALALAALGLFGVLSYTVKLRSREFGIRMALGAERGAIRGLVLRQGLRVTALGIAAGFVGAAALSRVMAPLVFQERALDPRVLAAAAVFLAAVAVVAAYVPARRATAVEPRAVLQ